MSTRIRRKVFGEGNPVVTVLLYALAALLALICIFPIYYVLVMSVTDAKYALSGSIYLLPRNPNLNAYKAIVTNAKMWRAYGNTIFYTVTNTVLMLVTSGICAELQGSDRQEVPDDIFADPHVCFGGDGSLFPGSYEAGTL